MTTQTVDAMLDLLGKALGELSDEELSKFCRGMELEREHRNREETIEYVKDRFTLTGKLARCAARPKYVRPKIAWELKDSCNVQ